MARVPLGQTATVTTTVRERQPDGSYLPVTPTTLALTVTAPDGTTTTFADPTPIGTGSYLQDVGSAVLNAAGRYTARWVATGPGAGTTTTLVTVYDAAAEALRSYIDLDTIKTALHITDDGRDELLAQAVTAASRSIDQVTGRRFWLDEAPSARVYNPRNRIYVDTDGEHLLVADIGDHDGLTVEVGSRAGGWTDITTTVEAEPTDALDRGWPVTSLLRPGAYWLEFATIQTRIRVTARWGWPAVPDDIVQAAQIQATRLFKRKDSPEGVAGSADWGVIRIGRTDPDVAALTGPYALAGFS
ncbi:phage head-tail connector protein [Frankia sp. AgB1.9]|uniref:phage head-tail connector protein n=1 Tax=Frankia sp. AgB1.9 TaxID=1836968 RepID=UPI00193185BD|nr:phage head-tail connector protein [Frankia sp. AgB1.9]MBL7546645.1 phage head-tail connector protein [Frankia sp. AgB1.9]